jgi:hypothetical protein
LTLRVSPLLISMSVLLLGLIGAPGANAQSTGGAGFGEAGKKKTAAAAQVGAPTVQAAIGEDGFAYAPLEAPAEVHAALAAANKIVGKPYKYGGGHAKVEDSGYDCSGTVSYALNGAGLLEDGIPLDSSSFMRWGEKGPGTWFTVYTNPGHAFAIIAGLRLDTSAAGDPSGRKGPRWRPTLRSTKGFRARHPEGW